MIDSRASKKDPMLIALNGETWRQREARRPAQRDRLVRPVQAPHAPFQRQSTSSRDGEMRIQSDRQSIAAWIVWLLRQAGPVTASGDRGGMTIEVLTEQVAQHRGKPTKEATICGRVAGGERAELAGQVRKSGRQRSSSAGVLVDVYELVEEIG